MKISTSDKTVDLSKAFPLSWGELEDLESQGVNLILGESISGMKQISTLVHFCAHKVNPDVTMEDIRGLDSRKLLPVFSYVAQEAGKQESIKGKRPS